MNFANWIIETPVIKLKCEDCGHLNDEYEVVEYTIKSRFFFRHVDQKIKPITTCKKCGGKNLTKTIGGKNGNTKNT